MKIGVTSAALEYSITVTALSLPVVFLGLQFVNFMDTVFAGPLGQLSRVAVGG